MVTELFDQSGNGNNAVLYSARNGPIPTINGQNSLLTLQWPGGSPDTGLASPAAVSNATGVSVFAVAKSIDPTYIASFIENWYYPNGGIVASPFTNIQISAGLTDTTSYHQSNVVMQQGDFNNFVTTYVDGSQIDTMPGCDYPLTFTAFNNPATLDIGFFRFFQPADFVGNIGQLVLIGAAASSGDIAAAHTLDKANWGTP
jgi:hypothetical protein